MKRALITLAVLLCTAGAWGAATVTPFPNNPNAVLVVTDGTAYLVVGNKPITSWVIGEPNPQPDPDPEPNPNPSPDPTPQPTRVSGFLILEEVGDRTPQQAKVLDNPIWQVAAVVKGLSYQTLDDDHPEAKAAAAEAAARGQKPPSVVFLDAGGKVLRVEPLPETVDAMRNLIGGIE